jgi:hypothetical protein
VSFIDGIDGDVAIAGADGPLARANLSHVREEDFQSRQADALAHGAENTSSLADPEFADTAARLSKEDGVSLNQWIATAVAQKIGVVETGAAFFRS